MPTVSDNLRDILSTLVNSKKTEINFVCPLCDRGTGEKKLYFNTQKLVGLCFRCGNTFDLFRLSTALLERGNVEILPVSTDKEEESSFKSCNFSVESVYNIPEAFKYLLHRNISPAKINKYKIFYSSSGYFKNRVVIPLYFGGEVRGLVGRIIDNSLSDRKYLFMPGMSVKDIIYPECNLSTEVILVEGAIDSIVANAVTSFSSFVSKEQASILKTRGVEVVYLCFDDDTWVPKYKQKPKIIAAFDNLTEAGLQVLPVKLEPGKDPADMGSKTLREYLKTQNFWLNEYQIKILKKRYK